MKTEKPFRKEPLKEKIIIIAIIAFAVSVILLMIIGLYYFGLLGLFHLLNVHYDSLKSLFLFVLVFLLISVIGDIIIKVLRIFIHAIIPSNWLQLFLSFLLIFSIIWTCFSIADNWMDSVQLGSSVQLITTLIFSLVELAFDGPKKDGSEE
ncbi:YrvL family regulatory protein [Niallia nealsonii]|uniref:Regulatory protein YrvL n=1 Tax=Niallia nealsonii TaxID=115979 RepID=A0A2N0Z326_9BACI|nr:YrvL family regulatory protein [Niallia nealsonii]PKG23897.1 hypothetical protein CWS01_08990 [Niallia nealsonii]